MSLLQFMLLIWICGNMAAAYLVDEYLDRWLA